MKPEQLSFPSVLEHSFRQRNKAIIKYARANRAKYISFATFIKPDTSKQSEIYARIAFAILSANSPFDASVRALGCAIEKYNRHTPITPRDLYRFGAFVPAKADYLNRLAERNLYDLKKTPFETWHEYRLRLTNIDGLGLTKASFAACLLYPMEADLACVDTWIQKVFLGHTGFRDISLKKYLQVERKIRRVARKVKVSTFVVQWMIWDHARKDVTDHAIFPGTHKGALP